MKRREFWRSFIDGVLYMVLAILCGALLVGVPITGAYAVAWMQS